MPKPSTFDVIVIGGGSVSNASRSDSFEPGRESPGVSRLEGVS